MATAKKSRARKERTLPKSGRHKPTDRPITKTKTVSDLEKSMKTDLNQYYYPELL